MPDFEATYFIDSKGYFSVNSEFFRAEQATIQWWQLTETSRGDRWLTFWCGGENFDISDQDQSAIAFPFFEKHLSHLERKK
jgi:hypothetical protein